MSLSLGTVTIVLAPEDAAVLTRLAVAMERIADALPQPERITGSVEPSRLWPVEALAAIERAITTAAPMLAEATPSPTESAAPAETRKPKRRQAGRGGVVASVEPATRTPSPTIATAARDVPEGTPWVFREHRTLAEVEAATTQTPSPTTASPTLAPAASRDADRAAIEKHLAEKGALTQPDFGDAELNALYPLIRARGHSFYRMAGRYAGPKPWVLDGMSYGRSKADLIAACKEIIEREKPRVAAE